MSWLRGFLTCLCLSLPAAAQVAKPTESTREALQRLTARDDVQTTLPGPDEPSRPHLRPPTTTPGRTQPTGPPRQEGRRTDRSIKISMGGSGMEGLAKVMAWGLVLVVVVLLLFALGNAWAERRRNAAASSRKARPHLTPAPTEAPPLRDYEQLAAEGRYAEAVHAMLMHAFVLLAQRRATGWPAARTGREILRAFGGFTTQDAPLRLIFDVSEGAWFGRLPVAREQYERCLQNFRGWGTT